MKVRVYSCINDGYLIVNTLTDDSLFDRYENYLSKELGIRYESVEVDTTGIKYDDNDGVQAILEDFGY